MAKRTDEKPFRPLESSLVREVMFGNAAQVLEPAVIPEPPVRQEALRPVETQRVDDPRPFTLTEHIEERRVQPISAEPQRRTVRREAPSSASSQLVERMEREKRVLLTPSEERALERVVVNIGAELGTSLKLSHVLRSCIRLVINAESELVERARATGRTVRPPNGDLAAIEGFEKIIANVLHAGIRTARPVR